MDQIGRVVATEKNPSTAYTFNFWAADDAKVGIGTLVIGHASLARSADVIRSLRR